MNNFRTLIPAIIFSVFLSGCLLFACKEEPVNIDPEPAENFETTLLMAMEAMTENDVVLAEKQDNGYLVTITRVK